MIKQLIMDLSYDNITLSKALMRAKIIAHRIENPEFKDWIKKELNGYVVGDSIPEYRQLQCELFATLVHYGNERLVPYMFGDADKEFEEAINPMKIYQSVSQIENSIKDNEEPFGYKDLPRNVVPIFQELTDNKLITSVKARVQMSQISNILNLVKQTLIDTLLELDDTFPNLQDKYQNTDENQKKTDTIINNHIYGDNNSSNIGVGNDFSQSITNNQYYKFKKFISALETMGIPNEDIDKIRDLADKEKGKPIGKKIIEWVGDLAQKATEKGVELQVPKILEMAREFL